jgi:O-antigen ligase
MLVVSHHNICRMEQPSTVRYIDRRLPLRLNYVGSNHLRNEMASLEGAIVLNILPLRRRWFEPSYSTVVIAITVLVLAPLSGWAIGTENWVMFSLVVGLGTLPVLARWPVVSTFGLYVLLLPFESVAMTRGATVARLVGIVAAGVMLGAGLIERRLVRPPLGTFWWIALVAWAALTAAWALDPEIATRQIPSSISLLGLFLIAVSLRVSRSELNTVCILTVIGGIAAVTAAYLFGFGANVEAGRRGTLAIGEAKTNANAFAASMLLPLALAFIAFLKLRNRVVKMVALAAVIMLVSGVYISMSRAALLALVVIVACLVYRTGVRWHAFLVVLVLVGLLATMPERFFTRVTSPVTGEDSTGGGRIEIWSVGLTALEEFWMWGAGISNFPIVYTRQVPITFGPMATASHNTYLGTFVELGIVGFVIMLLAMASQLRIAWRGRHSGSLILYATEASFLGLLVISFFGDTLWGKRLWTLCIMMVWAGRLAAESAAEPVSAEPPAKAARSNQRTPRLDGVT